MKDFAKPLKHSLDLIVSTRDVAASFDLAPYLSMLWVGSSLISVGLPDEPLPQFKPAAFMPNSSKLGGSHIGSKKEAMEMLELAAKKGVKPWIETMPMSRAKEAVEGVKDNKVRYRYVLVQDIIPGAATAGTAA